MESPNSLIRSSNAVDIGFGAREVSVGGPCRAQPPCVSAEISVPRPALASAYVQQGIPRLTLPLGSRKVACLSVDKTLLQVRKGSSLQASIHSPNPSSLITKRNTILRA